VKAERETTHLTDPAAAKRLLQSREGDAARGIPVSAKIGQVKIDELIADVVTDYRINRKRSLGHSLSAAYANTSSRFSAVAAQFRPRPPTSSGSFWLARRPVQPTPRSTASWKS